MQTEYVNVHILGFSRILELNYAISPADMACIKQKPEQKFYIVLTKSGTI